ncbi:MAG: class I mannose-6-phosphate isomerase [Treponema sp.]|nr:class I mannose-6-phosphate isomerase [Treponema sp.]
MKKLSAIRSEKIWGYEDWIASTHPGGQQPELLALAGGDYPLLVKVIQADETLSVQVHPDDEKAALYEQCRGKTECWYVLAAAENAQIVCGLSGDCSAQELESAIRSNSLQSCLKREAVSAGDFVYIPAGTVHAICGGLRLLEIQQSSDVTYRLYDWGRGRECHIEKGIACIKQSDSAKPGPFPGAFSCPYFSLEEITVKGALSVQTGQRRESYEPSDIVLFFVTDGTGTVNGESASREDMFAFAPGETAEFSGSLRLMKITPGGAR